ncbi:zinc finger domain-containing protein [Ophiocordyceps sinensis CO18]|uniref:Zinc finger domain-containing protein n=1 Tax=Ophiocordyceps sinensis (strain Co18 / CGMCC 3.14243) TaxID=911162 RepID=T5A9Q8_OPHSC|nr:zinc finger domain-containing protein [Ophiocordyceps sinensis CO18]
MPDTEGSQPRPQSQRQRGRGHPGRRSGRGGRGRAHEDGSGPGGGNVSSRDPPSIAATRPESRQQEVASERPSESHRGRSRRGRGPRPGGRVAAGRGTPRPATYRSFGGHLTSEADESGSAAPFLSADAPEFVPGQPVVSRSGQPRATAQDQPRVKLPKSMAADLGTRIHEDISNWNYECAICTDDVLRTSHVWSCTVCWTVVHLKCARKWHDNQTKQADFQSEPQSESTWRCPGCNSKLLDSPGSYHCWCGKEFKPSPASAALPPHSCGQTTLSAVRADGPVSVVLLRQEFVSEAVPGDGLRKWLELPGANRVTQGCAVDAIPGSRRYATAAASRSSFPATIGKMPIGHLTWRTMLGLRAHSAANSRATEALTVAFTTVQSHAMLRTSSHHTAPSHRMWLIIALVVRPSSTNSWTVPDSPVKTPSRAARNPARTRFHVGIGARRNVTLGPAASAVRRLTFIAGAAGQAPSRCVTKGTYSILSA